MSLDSYFGDRFCFMKSRKLSLNRKSEAMFPGEGCYK